MRKCIPLIVGGLLVLGASLCPFAGSSALRANARSGGDSSFVTPLYAEVPPGSIKPRGWLLHQLQIMKDGTTGHLDEVYGKLRNDNGWLGGKGDGWEETPYWLDGALPLAYLLEDARLKAKVLRYVNWTLDHQRPSGYFGPITKSERETGRPVSEENCEQGEDWWPKMVMLKVLQQYYLASKDPRVLPFMEKYFRYQLKTLKKCPLNKWTEWAESRGADNIMTVQWLYELNKDKKLLELASLLQQQAFPWSEWLGNRDWVISAAAWQNNENWMHRHGVNVGMGLKDPVIQYQRTHDIRFLKDFDTGFGDLMSLHGLPMGSFSADEDLHGNDPSQGTELCAIVESMFSLEQVIGITGQEKYMDALERMTFNALPTQTTDDYNNKQYFQMANQVQVDRGVYQFSLPFEREMNNVFGMRSGYTCCLANMHQGWTKFASHLWYTTQDKGLAALLFSPNRINTTVGRDNTPISITEETSYPFGDRIEFVIGSRKAVAFPLKLRIPAWCAEAQILLNGKLIRTEKGGQVISVDRIWKNKDVLTLSLPMRVTTSNWGKNSRAIERGPLVYALKLPEKWEKHEEKTEGTYYSVVAAGDWNYGLLEENIKTPGSSFEVSQINSPGADFIWNLKHAPIEITADAKKIPDWKLVNGVPVMPVTDRTGIYRGKVSDGLEKIQLIPYGCTKVRIVAFPVVK